MKFLTTAATALALSVTANAAFAACDDGEIVIGAGFQNTYNTRFRADRHAIQFFVRPKTGASKMVVEEFSLKAMTRGLTSSNQNLSQPFELKFHQKQNRLTVLLQNDDNRVNQGH